MFLSFAETQTRSFAHEKLDIDGVNYRDTDVLYFLKGYCDLLLIKRPDVPKINVSVAY